MKKLLIKKGDKIRRVRGSGVILADGTRES